MNGAARALWRIAVVFVVGASVPSFVGLSCATTRSDSEPPVARPAEVSGLAPLPTPSPMESANLGTAVAPDHQGATGGAAGDPTAAAPTPGRPAPIADSFSDGCGTAAGMQNVKRAALNRTLDAGLGTWLRGVDVEPKVDRGHFQGWRIRQLFAGDPCWAAIDLRAGDVVTRVNRRPIERPEEAQAVWTALRTSGEITVDFVRDGRPRTLRFSVVESPR